MDISPDRLPVKVDKPWGYEIWYAWTDRYVGKILHVKRGGRLSLQYHRQKDESSYVLRGRLLLTRGPSEDRLTVTEIGEGLRVAQSARRDPHDRGSRGRGRPGGLDPELDDVVRLRDMYGREGTSRP